MIRARALALYRDAERAGLVQSREEKALKGPSCSPCACGEGVEEMETSSLHYCMLEGLDQGHKSKQERLRPNMGKNLFTIRPAQQLSKLNRQARSILEGFSKC